MEKRLILQSSHSFLILPRTWSNSQARPQQAYGVSLQKFHSGKKFLVIPFSRVSSETHHVCILCGIWVCWLLFPSSAGTNPSGNGHCCFDRRIQLLRNLIPGKGSRCFPAEPAHSSWAEPDSQAVTLLLPDRAQRDTETLPFFFPPSREGF